MLTSEQEKWIAHLSDSDTVRIIPFDSDAERKFQKVKSRIQQLLGENTRVEHRGATSFGISGQDEIDVYIPVNPKTFDDYFEILKKALGEPRSLYPLERARFVTDEDGKHIDVFLINEESDGWKNGIKFEEYLVSHLEALENYEALKEEGNGLSIRDYYCRKIEFINDILVKCDFE